MPAHQPAPALGSEGQPLPKPKAAPLIASTNTASALANPLRKPAAATPPPIMNVAAKQQPAPPPAPKPAKMGLIDLHRQFWRLDRERTFSPAQTRVYYYFLEIFNSGELKPTGEYEYWPSQLTRRLNQVAADLAMDEDTLSRAALSLEARGLLSYTGGSKYVAATWQLSYQLGAQPALPTDTPHGKVKPKKSVRLKMDLNPHLDANFSGPSETDNFFQSHLEPNFSGSLSTSIEEDVFRVGVKEEKTVLSSAGGDLAAQKKIGAAAQALAPDPQPPTPSPTPEPEPEPEPAPELGFTARELAARIAQAFHVGQVKNAHGWAKLCEFCDAIEEEGLLSYLAEQFDAWVGVKNLTGLYKYNWRTYINAGTDPLQGRWCDHNWAEELAELESNPRKKSKSAHATTPTHVNSSQQHRPAAFGAPTGGNAKTAQYLQQLHSHNDGVQSNGWGAKPNPLAPLSSAPDADL